MSVDLSTLIDSLKRETAQPGQELTQFPGASDDSWLGYLQDAFWEARLDGLLADYTEDSNGIVTPMGGGGADMTRDLQQIVVLYASFTIVRNTLRNLRTLYRAQAGTVHYEYQQSANLLVELMKDLSRRRDMILSRLSDLGTVPSYYIDAVMARDQNMRDGLVWFVDSSHAPFAPYMPL